MLKANDGSRISILGGLGEEIGLREGGGGGGGRKQANVGKGDLKARWVVMKQTKSLELFKQMSLICL